MESRCSLIRGNVTDKTWASRYMSSPAIQQLLLPDFIVSLVHKSQLPRRAGPRRPAPTIIKIELSLIESNRFSPEYFWCFCLRALLCEWAAILTPPSGSFLLLFRFSFSSVLPSQLWEMLLKTDLQWFTEKTQTTTKKTKNKDFSFGEIVHFPGSLSCLKKTPSNCSYTIVHSESSGGLVECETFDWNTHSVTC